ncbi:MAG: aldolase [Frankia sp.]|nr:aldolase [Frankia sp.]
MPTLPEHLLARLTAPLAPVDALLAARHPGDPGTRQPVHTCYVPADRLHPDLVLEWGEAAREALAENAPSPGELAEATGLADALGGDRELVERVHAHVLSTLSLEPVQDLRVDLEDGYGIRPEATEDEHAVAAAEALRLASAAGALPASYGLRPKSLDPAVRDRGLRSLDLFLTALAGSDGGPPGLVLTLPKVSAPEQVTVFLAVLDELLPRLGLRPPAIELQIETPAAVLALPALVEAGRGRITGLHVGTYDYSAALGIAAEHQASDHPAVEYATTLMQLVTAGTGIRVSDGSSNLLPVGDRAAVHAAWRRHAELVTRAWRRGLYQGWDLHPAQLVSRHAAVAACLLAGLPAALRRLSAYAEARVAGAVADEPATARALAGHVLRALDAGLLDDAGLAAADLDRAVVHRLGGRPD